MSENNSNHLITVQKVIAVYRKLHTLNDRQLAALRANLTKARKACEDAGDAKLVEVLTNIEAKLPERKARPANEPQTVEEIIREYEAKYQQKSAGQQAAFKAMITRRINQAESEGLKDDFNQLLVFQARMEADSERIRRNYILAMATDLFDIDGDKAD